MKGVRRKDSAVSEVIGAVLVFAIFISVFTTVSSYYIPATQSAAETSYQSSTLAAMSDLNTLMSKPGYSTGTIINQYVPLGIQGGVLSPSRSTSLTYSSLGLSGSLSFGVGISFAYTEQAPTSAILNKLIGTIPIDSLSNPVAEAYDKANGNLYVAGFGSNDVAIIQVPTGTLLGYAYAGAGPKLIAIDYAANSIIVADNTTLNSTSSSYVTLSVISGTSNSVVQTVYIRDNSTYSGRPDTCFNITAMTYDPGNTTTGPTIDLAYNYYYNSASTNKNHLYSNVSVFSALNFQLLTNRQLGVNYVVSSLSACDFSNDSLIGIMKSPLSQYADNPSYSVFNPLTLSYYNVSIGFSTFYKSYGYCTSTKSVEPSSLSLLPLPYSAELTLKVLGLPGVKLTSIFTDPLSPGSGNLFFTFNITNQTKTVGTGSPNLAYPASGAVETTNSGGILGLAQFYSTPGYILAPNGLTSYSANVANSTFGSSIHSYKFGTNTPANDFVYNFTFQPNNYPVVLTGNQVGKEAKGIISIQATSLGNVSGYYFVTNTKSNSETMLTLNSAGYVTASTIIQDNYFNGPYASEYNPVNNYIYVTDYFGCSVSVLQPISNRLVGLIYLGAGTFPTNLTVNTGTGAVYVAESATNAIAVITNLSLSRVISLGANCYPVSVSYNPNTKSVYSSVNYEGSTQTGAYFLNISESGNYTRINSALLSGGKACQVALNGLNNVTYGMIEFSNGYFLYDLSINSQFNGYQLSIPSGKLISLTFDDYNGILYATSYSGNRVYLFQQATGSLFGSSDFTPSSPQFILTGSGPMGSVFDLANDLLYVVNSASNNLTIINTVNNTFFATIWIGTGPQFGTFDSELGCIFVPDFSLNKITILNGGFTIYNGRIGVFHSGSVPVGGSIHTTASTSFVQPISYTIEDGALIQNYTAAGKSNLISGLPFTLLNDSGNLYFTDTSFKLSLSNGLTNSTAGSVAPTDLKMQVVSSVNATYFQGSKFFITDIYGNQYQVAATNVYLENFSLNLNGRYASLFNDYMYSIYSGKTGNATNHWDFKGFPFIVNLAGQSLTVSMPIDAILPLYFVSILYYNIGLLEV